MCRWEDLRMRRYEDVKMRRYEEEKMWGWEDVWEDVKMWRWAAVKMWGCEDVRMWRWEDVKMWRCEDEKMWRCEDVKMGRCEDEKMWRGEDVLQTPTIGRTLRSDALGKKGIGNGDQLGTLNWPLGALGVSGNGRLGWAPTLSGHLSGKGKLWQCESHLKGCSKVPTNRKPLPFSLRTSVQELAPKSSAMLWPEGVEVTVSFLNLCILHEK